MDPMQQSFVPTLILYCSHCCLSLQSKLGSLPSDQRHSGQATYISSVGSLKIYYTACPQTHKKIKRSESYLWIFPCLLIDTLAIKMDVNKAAN